MKDLDLWINAGAATSSMTSFGYTWRSVEWEAIQLKLGGFRTVFLPATQKITRDENILPICETLSLKDYRSHHATLTGYDKSHRNPR